MMQVPMISTPLKQTNEIDWIAPLKAYIRHTYGDDPERYSEECSTLNRLRQDMRGAGKDSAAGRDLLYRYYGQLELLDLRFPVDENHIKISFTWFDAFTHKPTSQHSLAYEKASIIFNIAAVLSCHAAHQNRHEDTGLKTAYHSFQAAAGMFTYINENFLHAPSTDLNHETVRTLISVMLAQAQEVFLEKQIADDKKVAMLAKLASQASYLYSQAVEGVQENVTKAVFEKVWLLLTQVKASQMACIAQYYQALADNDANNYGVAIARLQSVERQSKEASRMANSFPGSLPANSNLASDTGSILVDVSKKYIALTQEKLVEFIKDNDFIYHQLIPNEASLSTIPKLPAARAISVSELYQGQDIHKIVGPDIFQRIVPMSVTESASLYDEEKAKMIRAETENAETANGEMAASLDYLKLPGSLIVLKGGADHEMSIDREFQRWCETLAGHEPFSQNFDELSADKKRIGGLLDQSSKQLDMEESVCEKMRSKYGAAWTQQPSSRLTATLRSDIRNYRSAVDEASISDAQLLSSFRQHESDFDEMRSAGEANEADILYQRAMLKAGAARSKGKEITGSTTEGNLLDEDFDDGSASVADQIAGVEELIKKLNLVKRERAQVLKDLKDKVLNDDISQVLILNKKSITNQENQLFKAELEKFRPHQNRLLQANHKQTSLMKELTRTYSDLLQDKRVRSEQSKHEVFSRQRGSVTTKYRKISQAFDDLVTGLTRARGFYSEMKDTVESLAQNVQTFVRNRKSEGGELLSHIEKGRASGSSEHADREHERLNELMERMDMDSRTTSHSSNRPAPLQNVPSYGSFQHPYNPAASPPMNAHYPNTRSTPVQSPHGHLHHPSQPASAYNPTNFGPVSPPPHQASPPPNQQHFSQSQAQTQTQYQRYASPAPHAQPYQQHRKQSSHTSLPPGYVPPPPPPGPPPLHDYGGAYTFSRPESRTQNGSLSSQLQNSGDPWAGLNGWR